MLSRTRLLIERDYKRLKVNRPWGIDAHPVTEGNYFEWTATIRGLKDTDWEGGIFRLYIKFDEYYNSAPPKVCFHSIPFHPNVDVITGQPGIDFLTDASQWKNSYDLEFILTTIQKMLSQPIPNSFVNLEAAEVMQLYPSIYQQTVYQCVTASQALFEEQSASENAIFVPLPAAIPITKEMDLSSPRLQPRRQKIPFEDYYAMWSNIATSKTPLNKAVLHHNSRSLVHYPSFSSTSDLSEHASFERPVKSMPKHNVEMRKKKDKIDRMRQLYMRQHGPSPVHLNSLSRTSHCDDDDFHISQLASYHSGAVDSDRDPDAVQEFRHHPGGGLAAGYGGSMGGKGLNLEPCRDSRRAGTDDVDVVGDCNEAEVDELVSWTNKLNV